jgi:hypothetical protein
MYAPQERTSTFVPPQAEQGYYQLKSRQQELSNQLESVTDRREELAQELHSRSITADREGIEARLKGLDNRILQLETDLASVGKDLVAATPASLTYPEPRINYRGYGEEDMVGAGLIGFGIAVALGIPFFIRAFRRRRNAPPSATSQQLPAASSERMDRMEQSIDSIAVEIERVSENQRFMTRLMTETQLAGTIAAVRGSAEAAKAAAENSRNV